MSKPAVGLWSESETGTSFGEDAYGVVYRRTGEPGAFKYETQLLGEWVPWAAPRRIYLCPLAAAEAGDDLSSGDA